LGTKSYIYPQTDLRTICNVEYPGDVGTLSSCFVTLLHYSAFRFDIVRVMRWTGQEACRK